MTNAEYLERLMKGGRVTRSAISKPPQNTATTGESLLKKRDSAALSSRSRGKQASKIEKVRRSPGRPRLKRSPIISECQDQLYLSQNNDDNDDDDGGDDSKENEVDDQFDKEEIDSSEQISSSFSEIQDEEKDDSDSDQSDYDDNNNNNVEDSNRSNSRRSSSARNYSSKLQIKVKSSTKLYRQEEKKNDKKLQKNPSQISKSKLKHDYVFFKQKNQKLQEIQLSFSLSNLSLGPLLTGRHLVYKYHNEDNYKMAKIDKVNDSQITLNQIWSLSTYKQELEKRMSLQELRLEIQSYLFCGIGYRIIKDQIKPIILLQHLYGNSKIQQLQEEKEQPSPQLLKRYFQREEYYFKQTENLLEDHSIAFSRQQIYGYQFTSNKLMRISSNLVIDNIHCIDMQDKTNFDQTNLFEIIQSSNSLASSIAFRKLIDVQRSFHKTKAQLSSYQLTDANIEKSIYHQIQISFPQQRLIPLLNLPVATNFVAAKAKKGNMNKDKIGQPIKHNQNTEELTKKGILLNYLPKFKQIMIRLYESTQAHWLPLDLCGDKIDIRVNYFKGFVSNQSIESLDISHPLNSADLDFLNLKQNSEQIKSQQDIEKKLTTPYNSLDSIGQQCFKCRDALTNEDERLQCSSCKKNFHISCLTYLSEQILSQLSIIEQWHCPACMPCINCKTRASAPSNCTFLICNKCNKGTHYQCLCPTIKALVPAPVANKYNEDESQPNFKLQFNMNNQLKFKINPKQNFNMMQQEDQEEAKEQLASYPDVNNKQDQGFDIEIPNNIILEHSFSQS